MKLIVAGTGYVGLVQAAVCSEYGHEVYAYDVDKDKIDAFSTCQDDEIEKFVMEPGLSNIIRETHGKSLFFSNDLKAITASVVGLTTGMTDEIQRLPIGTAIITGGKITMPLFVEIRPRETRHGGESVTIVERSSEKGLAY